MKRLTLVLPLSILLTFLLLFSAFGSVWDAGIILFNMPIALLGGLVGLAAVGMTLSVSAAVGFIALLGQAVLNGVLVVKRDPDPARPRRAPVDRDDRGRARPACARC